MDRNMLMITAIVLTVSILIGFNFIYEPNMKELRALEQMQGEELEKKSLLDEIATYEKKIALYQKHWVPRGKEEVELLNRVRDIAAECQVQVTALTPQSKREFWGGGSRKFPIAISFEGTYHALGDFISKVESMGIFMKVDRLEFAQTSGEEGQPPLQCEVILSVFSTP